VKLGSRLLIGALAGLAGTAAMTSAMRRMDRRLPGKERYPLPPREIVDSTLAPPDEPARDLTIAMHFAYGAACGAVLGTVNPRMGKLTGAAAGGAIWLGSYMGWIPAFAVLEPATRHPLRRNALMIGVHFVWGWSTAGAMRELQAARGTIFASGTDRDLPVRKRRG
jgi:uncharacterized membrane protein YagU involved in acid resistance